MAEKAADQIIGSWMIARWRYRVDIIRDGSYYHGVLAEGFDNGETDTANPNPSLRDRPLLGLRLFEGLRYRDGEWTGGKLYHPESGRSYAARLRLHKADSLDLRAYLGHPLLGLTQTLERQRERPELEASSIASDAGLSAGDVWPPAKAAAWYAARPWPVGCDYIPATAVNQIDMWRRGAFDIDLITRELALAGSLGFNLLRVYLHDLAWLEDASGLAERMKRFLDAADSFGLSVLFVLFDDCWNDKPRPGRQKQPIPGVHNSRWVRGPGTAAITNETAWGRLADYAGSIVSAFAKDERVFGWDLYNEIGNSAGLLDNSTRLLGRVFRWARQAAPTQPLTAGVWKYASWYAGLNLFLIDYSDIISFHDYSKLESLVPRLDRFAAYGKPLVCTEYLARTQGSLFQSHLPLFKDRGVGALNWGLVQGKTQTVYPWGSRRGAGEPAVWFHDIFRPNGEPYDPEEIALIQALSGR